MVANKGTCNNAIFTDLSLVLEPFCVDLVWKLLKKYVYLFGISIQKISMNQQAHHSEQTNEITSVHNNLDL